MITSARLKQHVETSKLRKVENSKSRNAQAPGRLFARLPVFAFMFAIVGAVVLSGGCTSDGYPLENSWHTQGKAPSSSPQPATFAYRYPDIPPVLNARDLKEFAARFRHRVILIDFWASWSRRTREEMTMLARLQDDLDDEGFQVIGCSLDPEEKWGSVIVPMLHASNANFPCVVIPEAAKAGIREWLAPNWSYDLPARFILDRNGNVVAQELSVASLSDVEQQVRKYVNGVSGRTYSAALTESASAIRAKLVDVRAGKGESIPEMTADPSSAKRLAEQVADAISVRADRSKNPRLAILPFGDAKDRRRATTLGRETADQLAAMLKEKGYFDVLSPEQTQKVVDEMGLSAMSIDYEAGLIKGKLSADYLIMGWIRTQTSNDTRPVQQAVAKPARPAPSPAFREIVDEETPEPEP